MGSRDFLLFFLRGLKMKKSLLNTLLLLLLVIAVTDPASAASITWVSEVPIAAGSDGNELSTEGTVIYAIDPTRLGEHTIGDVTFTV
jgi:hypothetical protein